MDSSLPPIPQPLTFEEPSPNPNAPLPPRPSSSRDPASSLSPPPSLPPPATNKSRTVKLKTSNPLPAAAQDTVLAESSEDDDDEEGADGGGGGSEGVFSHTVKPSRVQKIIKADKDIHACTKEAVFLIACATEFFIKRFADQSYLKARLDQRKTVGLKDMASAVRTTSELTFLEDMVPAPIPLSQALSLKTAKETAASTPSTTNPQIATASTSSHPPPPPPQQLQPGEEPMPFFLPAAAKVATKGKGRGNGATAAPKKGAGGRKSAGGGAAAGGASDKGSGSEGGGGNVRERLKDGEKAAPMPKLGKSPLPPSSLSTRNSLRRSAGGAGTPTSYVEPGEDDLLDYPQQHLHPEPHPPSHPVPPAVEEAGGAGAGEEAERVGGEGAEAFPSLPAGLGRGDGLGRVAAGDVDSMRVD